MAILWPECSDDSGELAKLRASLKRAGIDAAPLVSIKCSPSEAVVCRASVAVHRRRVGESLDEILGSVGWELPYLARSRIAPLINDLDLIEYVHFGVEVRNAEATRKLYLAFQPHTATLLELLQVDPALLLVAVKWNAASPEQWRLSEYRDADTRMIERMEQAVNLADDAGWTRAASELLSAVSWRVGEEGDVIQVVEEGSGRWSIDARVGSLSANSERCIDKWLARYNLQRGPITSSVLRIAVGSAKDQTPFITIYGR